MGKVAKNFSLLQRSTNRVGQRPPSSNGGDAWPEAEEDDVQSRKEKRLSEKRAQRDNGGYFWDNLRGKLFHPYSYKDVDWRMSLGIIAKILFSVRVMSSFWSQIADCDEVYNYWEPLHLLVFGRGFQTWEYSPIYAIRHVDILFLFSGSGAVTTSWFYIWIHSLPAKMLFPALASSKVAFFHTLRGVIGLVSLVSDVVLYESVCQRLGNSVGRLYIILSIFSVGMFNTSCAFLPSSFSMTLNAFAMAAYLSEKWFLAVLFTAISALVGWPFAAVLGAPIFIEMFVLRFRHLGFRFVLYAALSAVLVLLPMHLTDTVYYGKPVIAPLNIVLYNVFSEHGPDLYGIEPVSFYVKNLLLNWNIVAILAILSLPLSLYVYVRSSYVLDDNDKPVYMRPESAISYWYRYMPVALMFLSTFLWVVIFFSQPHKEERFLFPIFPMIALLAAVALDSLWRIHARLTPVVVALVTVFLVLSVSRGYALHRNYMGAMDTYKGFHDQFMFNQENQDFSKMNDPIRLCVGKEWYRFPSSFFLPEKVVDKRGRKRQVEMRFLRSEFRGLLPKPYAQGPVPNVTRTIPTEMNDANTEEPTRYVPLDSCDYVVDLDTSRDTELEPNYAKMNTFEPIVERRFLLSGESHPFFRAFFVPFTDNRLRYGTYRVLRRIRM